MKIKSRRKRKLLGNQINIYRKGLRAVHGFKNTANYNY